MPQARRQTAAVGNQVVYGERAEPPRRMSEQTVQPNAFANIHGFHLTEQGTSSFSIAQVVQAGYRTTLDGERNQPLRQVISPEDEQWRQPEPRAKTVESQQAVG